MPTIVDSPETRRLAVGDAEGAALIGCGRTKLRELIRDGELRAVHIGRRLVIPVSELERYLQNQLESAGN